MENRRDSTHEKKDAPTILVIDDDVDCCLFIEKSLSFQGYRVISATNGKEGLGLLEKNNCLGVLLDIFLPDSDGVDIAHQIKKKKGDNFPVIALTCTPFETLKRRFPNTLSIFNDICIKPFTYEVLLEKVHHFDFSENAAQDPFHSIIEDYRASIPSRLELLQALIDGIRTNPTEETLKELRLQIHKLAGSAGIYGYDDVSKVCKEFDELLEQRIKEFEQEKKAEGWSDDFESTLEVIRKGFSGVEGFEKNTLKRKIIEKRAVIGVIGLGSIGLSLLDSFAQAGFPLAGFDINPQRVEMLKEKESYLNFLDMTLLFSFIDQNKFKPSADPKILDEADVLIICVPTSIDQYGTPNLSNLRSAFETVAGHLKKQQLVILQSSTYPGTTREELLPILNKSNLKVGVDIFLAHAPEIADFGNEEYDFMKVPRIVSGITPACMKMVSLLYQFITVKVVPCATTEIAEAAKLLQNAFRLINISFINEMKILFDRMNIDVWDVIEAAASKPFGFMPFYPSPGIGGDCIPIAPFYLVWKAKVTGGPTTMLEDAGRINNAMAHYVISKIVYGLNLRKKTIRDSKILILGITYKKDINDVRESPAIKILPLLNNMLAHVFYHDPFVRTISYFPGYPSFSMESIDFEYETLHLYDAVVVLTNHSCYDWVNIAKHTDLLIDTRNISSELTDTSNIIKA